MKPILSLVFLLLVCPVVAQTQPASVPASASASQPVVAQVKSVAEQLQEISVTLTTGSGEGSGVIVKRGDQNFVLTAAHVVDSLRKTRTVIDPKTGTERKIVEFDNANIVQMLYEDGRKVGKIEMSARVICYSDADNGEDLAVLLVEKKNFINASATFSQERNPAPVGAELYHVGSLRGQFGSNSVTTGIVSQIGRVYENKLFDQSSCPAFPGSSGGGVFLKDGKYIGMLVRGGGETLNLFTPIRRIQDWTKKMGLQFILNPDIQVLSDEELKKIPMEDTGKVFGGSVSKNKEQVPTTQAAEKVKYLPYLP